MHRTLRGSYSQLDRFLYLPTIPTVLTIRTYNTKSTNTTSSHRGSTAEAVACWGRSQAVRQDGQNRNDQPNTLALCFKQAVQALRADPQAFTSTISLAKSATHKRRRLPKATSTSRKQPQQLDAGASASSLVHPRADDSESSDNGRVCS